MSEHRILRSRILDQADLRDSGYSPPSEGTPAMIGQVFDGGLMPTSNDHYYLVHPVEIDGDPCEACPGTIVADTDSSVAVDVIGGRIPAPGDLLECFFVGGRWCAESRGGSCLVTVCVTCGTAEVPAVSGAVVTIKDGPTTIASGTTDATGCVALNAREAGTYQIRIASTVGPTTNASRAVTCGGELDFDVCGICTGGVCPLPAEDLTLTLSTDNGPPVVLVLTYNPPGVGETNGTYVNFYQGGITFRLHCSDPSGWQLQVTFADVTNPGHGSTTCDLILTGDCSGPDLTAVDLEPCTNLTVSTHFILPVTITS